MIAEAAALVAAAAALAEALDQYGDLLHGPLRAARPLECQAQQVHARDRFVDGAD